MDKRLKINVSSGSWTNEKHVQFLNWVEASFVRTTFEGSSSNRRLLPLNRYIPDSSESTQDLKSQRKKKLHPPDLMDLPPARVNSGADEKPRRLSSEPSDSSHDQVVPQLMLDKATDHKVN